jgi:hypothetical protein
MAGPEVSIAGSIIPAAARDGLDVASAIVALFAVVPAAAGAPAHGAAAPTKHCADVRVDRFLHIARHGAFGATGIRARGTTCVTARRVASRYVHDRGGPDSTQMVFVGWTCTFRSVPVAQEIAVTCRRGNGRVTFRDTLPSG